MSATYTEELGFTVEEMVMTEGEDSYTFTFEANAEEDDYYGKERVISEITVDAYTGEVTYLRKVNYIWDMGYEDEDLNVSANNITDVSLTIKETGTRSKGGVTRFDDIYSIPNAEIINNVPQIPEISEGDLSDEEVLAIFDNIVAYTEGTVKDEYTIDTSSLIDLTTFDSLGNAKGVGVSTLYEDDLFIDECVYTLEDGSSLTYKQRYEAGDAAVIGGEGEDSYEIPGEYVMEWSTYFTPGPVTATGSTAVSIYTFSDIASSGIGKNVGEYTTTNVVINKATNVDGVIDIEFTYASESDWSSFQKEVVLKIEDNFLSYISGTQHDDATAWSEEATCTEVHVLTKGEPYARADA